jgi:hypothetical protein
MLPFRLKGPARKVASLLTCAFWLVACGGGVDSGGTGSFASGPITGFGSIIVGGVRYDDTSATVTDEFGAPSDTGRLRLGMLTEIQASAPTGAASMRSAKAMSVRFRSEIVGPVDRVDTQAGTLAVLGQSVTIGAKTVFDPDLVGGLTAVRVGDVLEVYGQYDASARRYTATRIELRAPAGLFKLRGPVSAADPAARTLVIGGQTIDYGGVANAPAIVVDQTLRVLLQTVPRGTTWTATVVEVGVNLLPDRAVAEIEGRITSFVSVRQFAVDGFAVETSAATQFPDGTAGLLLGARVEAEGSTSNGVLSARKVVLKNDDDSNEAFELSGSLSALDTVAKTFVVRGVTVSYANTQRFEGGLESDLPRARRAEVRGSLSSDGTRLEASSIHMEL